jgi:alkylation response protein AidB-like acyl-CoA dehydrogenase
MNLLPTQEQQQIVDMVRSFLDDHAKVERLRPDKFGQIGNPDAVLWPRLGELGVLGLGVPEEAGGLGLSAVEEALVYTELGRALASIAVLGATLGAHLAARAGIDHAADIVAGTLPVGLAVPRRPLTIGPCISGEVHLIEAEGAELVVLLAGDGVALLHTAHFKEIEERLSMDSHMRLARARFDEMQPIVWAGADDPVYTRADVLIAAYATGCAEASLALAVDYAKMREQFGKPIGSFQAVKHKCADMAIAAEVASCQTAFAAISHAEGMPDAAFHALAARIVAVDAALRNGATGIQVHGAIGFTAEVDAHLYVKRAHLLDFLGGTLREQRAGMMRIDAAV